MLAIRYTTYHTTFDGAIRSKDLLAQFPDFIDWDIELSSGQPYIVLHVYVQDDGSEVLPGNCERVEFTPCQEEEIVIQSMLEVNNV